MGSSTFGGFRLSSLSLVSLSSEIFARENTRQNTRRFRVLIVVKNFENDDQRFGVRSMHSDQIFFLFFRKKGWPSKSFEIIIVVVVGNFVPCFQPTGRLLREDEEEKLLLFFEHQNRGDNFGIIEQY